MIDNKVVFIRQTPPEACLIALFSTRFTDKLNPFRVMSNVSIIRFVKLKTLKWVEATSQYALKGRLYTKAIQADLAGVHQNTGRV